ncbi:lysophospholipid acyltransferase family protein [Desulfogranum mediterraneum]|uniref:lysophospholipid acyltransferase family protein n=1 Tax=Desulfogranum mediterraneum TaxID=160661 RepID=UPI000401D4A7|nr:lysophospholipid acyltransferase family protein [Desulfogranum mediterraneum]
MRGFWYRLLVRCSSCCGPWLLKLVSRLIALGYFLFSRQVAESCRFYAALYPEQGALYHRWCSFRQYQRFTSIHLDRFLARERGTPSCTSRGWERLEALIGGQGGILLMSHLGNWEMAAALLKQQRGDLQLLLYMGVKEQEGVERCQKEELRRAGVTIIGVEQGSDAPMSGVEAIRCLQAGGLVSMAGDQLWREEQRRVEVSFLGHRAFLPQAPFVFALVAGAPLLPFFAFRQGDNHYHFSLAEPITIERVARGERDQAISRAAQEYADLLAATLRRHPFEWYHFERFLH